MAGNFQNLSCTVYEAVYTFQIDYKEGLETVTTTNTQLGPMLNSSNIYTDFGMFPQNEGNATDNPVVNATSIGSGGGNVTDTNRRANMAAIQDTVVDAFSGYIDALSKYALRHNHIVFNLTSEYSTPRPTIRQHSHRFDRSLLRHNDIPYFQHNRRINATPAPKHRYINAHPQPNDYSNQRDSFRECERILL